MKRRLLRAASVAVSALLLWSFWPASSSERAAWEADYAALKRFTESSYANLGDRLASREISPRALDESTAAALATARNGRSARRALAGFVRAFDDRHFRAEAPHGPARRWLRRLLGKDRAPTGSDRLPRTATAEAACAAIGARDRRGGGLDFAELPGWQPLPADAAAAPFPAGTLPGPGGASAGALGVLRIGLFSAAAYPELCLADWPRFLASPAGASCGEGGDDCLEPFWEHLQESTLAALAREVEALAAAGASTLLLDLTGNGGGNEIVGEMAKILSPRPLPRRAFGFIRHPHWAKRLADEVAWFDSELATSTLSPEQRAFVEAARERVERMRVEAERPCDLAAIWRSDTSTLPCSNVARSEPYLPLPTPELVRGLKSESDLLLAAELASAPGSWRGELWIAVDGGTASAAEDLVASLVDAGAASTVGVRTMGIGCGYTNGGVRLELPGVGLRIYAPDCIRYRADGSNEAEGIAPDVEIDGYRELSGAERAAKVVAAVAAR
jgi:hypothetical protein